MFDAMQAWLYSFVGWLHPHLGGSIWFMGLLLGTGILYTLMLGVPQIRSLKESWKSMFGQQDGSEGDIKPRQALLSALSGTVGTGNIGGVAVAIFIGGPAALFWMWMTAFFGMAIKLGEISLSHKYRDKLADGTMSGGPMQVIHKRLNMRWLAGIFAAMTMFNALIQGNSIQMSTMADALDNNLGVPVWLAATVLSGLLALTILGGVRTIARSAEVLIPTMQVLYLGGCLVVIGANIGNLIPALGDILGSVFSGTAATGGFLGASVTYALRSGVGRGLFSNEAGQGSSPIAHAASKEPNSMREAVLGMLEPLIDTLIICSLTGFAILSSGVWNQKYEQEFEKSGMYYFVGDLNEADAEQAGQLRNFVIREEHGLEFYSGPLQIRNGRADGMPAVSLLANRSLAEEVRYLTPAGEPYSGEVSIREGRFGGGNAVGVHGKALLSSVLLTSKAFEESPLGWLGPIIIALSLVMFAFTTATVWSYYGDRATSWFFGVRGVLPYRLLYILIFGASAFVDGGVIWRLSDISIAVMALPNLLALLLLSREVRKDYRHWRKGL